MEPGSRVVVVDDVITRGSSTVKAVEAVREHGCAVLAVVALVDRLQGARELFADKGITDYRPVFTIRPLARRKWSCPAPCIVRPRSSIQSPALVQSFR